MYLWSLNVIKTTIRALESEFWHQSFQFIYQLAVIIENNITNGHDYDIV